MTFLCSNSLGVFASLLQIGSNYLDQFFGSLCLGRVLSTFGGEDMKSDVPFHDFSHQTIQRPATSSHKLKHAGTFLLGFESTFDGVDLPANAPDPSQKFFFVFGCVSHGVTIL